MIEELYKQVNNQHFQINAQDINFRGQDNSDILSDYIWNIFPNSNIDEIIIGLREEVESEDIR